MKAIFPDTKLLQPIPAPNGEHANISGNVNNTSQASPIILNEQNTQNILPETQPKSAKNENTFPFFALFSVIILLLIFAGIFIYRKFRKK
jgi:hypothetical protein